MSGFFYLTMSAINCGVSVTISRQMRFVKYEDKDNHNDDTEDRHDGSIHQRFPSGSRNGRPPLLL